MSIIDPKQIVARMKSNSLSKQANTSVPADPTAQGIAKVKKHEGDDPNKQQLPTDGTPGKDESADFTQKQLNAKGNAKVNSKPSGACNKAASASGKLASIRAKLNKKAANAPIQELAPEFNQELMLKLASTMLESEDGVRAARNVIEKKAGYEAARSIIEGAQAENMVATDLNKQASQAIQAGNQDILAVSGILEEAGLTDGLASELTKVAAYHEELTQDAVFSHPLIKRAYAGGMDDAAALEDAAMAGEEASIPGGGEEVTDEDIMVVLQLLVESGQVSEEEATEFLQALVGSAESLEEPVV